MKTAIALFFAVLHVVSANDTVRTPAMEFFKPSYQVYARTWSPDGTHRIDGCSDGKVRFIPTSDMLTSGELAVSQAAITSFRYTPSFAFLMAFAADSTLYRIDWANRTVQQSVVPRMSSFRITSYSADGLYGISWSVTDSSRIQHNLSTGENRPCFSGLTGDNTQLVTQITPDGKKLVALLPKNSIMQMRSAHDDSLLFTLHLPDSLMAIDVASISAESSLAAIVMSSIATPQKSYFVIVESEKGTITDILPLTTKDGNLMLGYHGTREFVLSPHGTKLFAGNSTQFAVYDLVKRSRIFDLSHFYSNYSSYQARFSPDEKSLFIHRKHTGSYTDSLLRYDLATKQPQLISTHQEPPSIIASGFSSRGAVLIGRYRYDQSGSEKEWDSLVYFEATTGKEVLPKKYIIKSNINTPYVGWFFSGNGSMLYENIIHQVPRLSTTRAGELNVYSFETTARIFSLNSGARQTVIAQDKKHLCVFDTSTVTIISCETFDSTKKALSIPAEWVITTADLDASLVCAFKIEQKSQFDTVLCIAGIWSLSSGACLTQFITNRNSWLYNSAFGMDSRFLPDGMHMVVKGNSSRIDDSQTLSLFNIHTGKKVIDYPGSRIVGDMSLTPDGRQVLYGIPDSGIQCYDAITGAPQRFFATAYKMASLRSEPFSFNPMNPRQFIAGSTVWELPAPLAAKTGSPSQRPMVDVASLTTRGIELTGNAQKPVVLTIIRPDGKVATRLNVQAATTYRRFVALPTSFAQGLYIVRLDCGGKVSYSGRLVMVP